MQDFIPATAGWSPGPLHYGAGLQLLHYGYTSNGSIPVYGHLGITYTWLLGSWDRTGVG